VAGSSGLNHQIPVVKLPNRSGELIVCFGGGDMDTIRAQVTTPIKTQWPTTGTFPLGITCR